MLIRFLLEDVLNFHSQLTEKGSGIRDLGLIESAVNAPFQTFGEQDLYPTVFDKAAQLAYGLTENHGFVDGNKRAAIHSMMVYLILNGFDLIADENELFKVSMSLAAGKISSSELANWLKCNVKHIRTAEFITQTKELPSLKAE